jgi:hypothetical protein
VTAKPLRLLAPPADVLVLQPDLRPLNANERLHWAAKSVRTAAWRGHAARMAVAAGLPKHQRAHITVTVSFPDKRRRDVHNLFPTAKAIVDGLVADYGLLPGDDDRYLVGPDMRRGEKCAGLPVFTVTITPLDAGGRARARAPRPDEFDGYGTAEARWACAHCPIRQGCLEDALAAPGWSTTGVYRGGVAFSQQGKHASRPMGLRRIEWHEWKRMHEVDHLTIAQIGRRVGRHHTTVLNAILRLRDEGAA